MAIFNSYVKLPEGILGRCRVQSPDRGHRSNLDYRQTAPQVKAISNFVDVLTKPGIPGYPKCCLKETLLEILKRGRFWRVSLGVEGSRISHFYTFLGFSFNPLWRWMVRHQGIDRNSKGPRDHTLDGFNTCEFHWARHLCKQQLTALKKYAWNPSAGSLGGSGSWTIVCHWRYCAI